MHRIFSGGLALVLGVAAAPVAGQDNRPETSPQKRIARLGQPVAVHDGAAPADQEVTTAGLLRRRVMTTVGSPPAESPLVPSVAPLNPSTIPSFGPVPGNIGPTSFPSTNVSPTPLPRPTANSPTVTEDRAKNTMPVAPGYPNYVPSVVPDGGMVFQQSPIDAPLYGDALPVGSPVERLANCGRWRITGEYLMWWSRAADLPALVTTSSLPFNGQIGNGDTQVLVGNGGFGETFHSGLRLSGVRWFGNSECRGLDGRIFFLGQAASSFTATGGQYPLLARPFINPNPGTPFYGSDAEIVSAMGFLNGGVTVQLENTIWGAEANYRRYLWSTPFFRVDGLVGYRFLNYNEKLQITENFIRPPFSNMTGGVPAVMGTVVDQFRTENYFNGGQVGLTGEWRRGRWSIDSRASIAFGNLQRVAEISGNQSFLLANGMMAGANGGLLAVPGANIGEFRDNVFAVVPEVGVNVGYQITSRLRFFVGYNFLYLSNALRPGNVIDPYVDPARIPNFLGTPATPIPGIAHPTPQFRSAGFFVQGISFGLRFDW